ncbi:MAG: 16S rRNA (cytosine(1402)-N(4))-methyltransferase RsmH [Planctomycetes bacterium]|nr:16S rRNA (cytosine(1402)-N(4))-methyltransferase RsmH [Planctomycetota bacterium]
MANAHIPVLLDEVLAVLDPRPGHVLADCTVGLGGHAAELLRRVAPGGRVLGLDLDPSNLTAADAHLRGVAGGIFSLHHDNFAALPSVLARSGVDRVHGLLADLGVSSPHLDDPARGFSYRRPGPLDMRMDSTRGRPAWALLERMGEGELAATLRDLGDEEDADEIARLVVERRAQAPIRTTEALTAIVCEARDFTLQRAAGAKLHPAARTFQALRILVNREGANLERLLQVAPDCLEPGGVVAVISFHSGEDRRVKRSFREGLGRGIYAEGSREALVAGEAEREANPRSRSAKLRWARRAGREEEARAEHRARQETTPADRKPGSSA